MFGLAISYFCPAQYCVSVITSVIRPSKTNLAIARSFSVLEILSKQPEGTGVRELAALAAIPPAAAERILVTLMSCGFVRRSPDGRYALTTKVLQIAENLFERMELPRIAAPILQEIRDRCDETVSLFVVEGNAACLHSL